MTPKTQASADYMEAISKAMEAHYRYIGLNEEQQYNADRYGHHAHGYIADKVAIMIEESLTDAGIDKIFGE